MADSERFELEQLIRECRRALTTSAVRQGEQLDSDMDTLLHRVRQRRAVRDYTTEVLEAQASRDAVMEAEQERIDRLAATYGINTAATDADEATATETQEPASAVASTETAELTGENDGAQEARAEVAEVAEETAVAEEMAVVEAAEVAAEATERAEAAEVAEAVAATAAAVVAEVALNEAAETTVASAGENRAETGDPSSQSAVVVDTVTLELDIVSDADSGSATGDSGETTGWCQPQAAPGRVIFVVGKHRYAQELVATAQRLARRIDGPAQVILGGPKTQLPGNEERVKSARELVDAVVDRADTTTILVLATSNIAAHQKTLNAIVQAVEPAATWVVVDVADTQDSLTQQLAELPDGIHADVLAPFNCWDTFNEEWRAETDLPIGMLDGAPASAPLWGLIHASHQA